MSGLPPVGSDDLAAYRRRLSPAAQPRGPLLRLLRAQVGAEIRQNLRVPEYLVGVVAVPVLLFAMFGLPEAGQVMPGGTDIGAMMFASMACFGVVSLAIFTFGVDVAHERGRGWHRRLRATPMPMWAYFVGKASMALAFAALIVALMLAVALVGGVEFSLVRLVRTVLVLLVGALAFAPAGLALAYWARPRSATAVGNLLFLPLAFVSGFFYTLNGLPGLLQNIAPYLPTYHFGQLAWTQMAPDVDVVDFGSPAPQSPFTHLAVVAICFAVFSALAVAGYRRDVDKERG